MKNPKKKLQKVWKLSTADSKFSAFIRNRDKECLRCSSKFYLQCSHFWSRNHFNTRFDPDNCITICYPCHYGSNKGWEYDQAGEYRDFMIKRLGIKKFKQLENKHKQFKTKRNAIIEFMEWLKRKTA